MITHHPVFLSFRFPVSGVPVFAFFCFALFLFSWIPLCPFAHFLVSLFSVFPVFLFCCSPVYRFFLFPHFPVFPFPCCAVCPCLPGISALWIVGLGRSVPRSCLPPRVVFVRDAHFMVWCVLYLIQPLRRRFPRHLHIHVLVAQPPYLFISSMVSTQAWCFLFVTNGL